ncbi:hypothetical protein GON26_14255 [Flavobacterium sp. GA093]|uniref:Uncharacterized protein n=1 Tax=Flavobacterium hydrocarbonoxydans TaxID=2683249 RepID=A0A6I4NV33_9FLAO|nr:hypothetical protein [Flavobacterium hydrocarbonoxydans]MWB95529.1 hypothetical protein [Flavobacterium hydrocarbonoxydans]
MSTFRKITKNSDGTFGPTKSNNFYKPVAYHNKSSITKRHKTKWIIKQNEQYCTFELSHNNKWKCSIQQGYFSIVENGKFIMGSNEEVLGFFPEIVNMTDPYHGYPVSSAEYEISNPLLVKWLADKVIDNRIYIKLLKCQL